jgi:hypothetical protein
MKGEIMGDDSLDRVKWPAELVEEICELAEGPARAVLEEAVRDWLDGHKQALRAGRSPHLPYPADQSDPYSPDPKQPLPMPDFGAGCAVLAAVHDQNCARCVAWWPMPTTDDPVGGVIWVSLRQKVSEQSDPAYVRKILAVVRAELQKRKEHKAAPDLTGVAPRNAWFLARHEESGSGTFHKPKCIMVMWNNLPKEEQSKICPGHIGKVTFDTVKKGIKLARIARDGKPKRKAKKPAKRKP